MSGVKSELQAIKARIDELERQLALHHDINAINGVLADYCRALDWLAPERLERVFFDDADIDYGFFVGSGRDFRDVLAEAIRNASPRWHSSSTIKIAHRGDVAEVESYGLSVSGVCKPDGSSHQLMSFCGLYLDRFERRNEAWRIARRKYLLLSCAKLEQIDAQDDVLGLNQLVDGSPAHPDFRTLDSECG